MTYKEAVALGVAELNDISDSAKLDSELLICNTCQISHSKYFAHPETKLSINEKNIFTKMLERRCNGEPIAYILGSKEFWSLLFHVNKDVLIPRSETELLVELSLEIIKDQVKPKVLDLGTGSGAISIAIAKERPDAKVVAIDYSEAALNIARKNQKLHNVNIQFIHSNWFERLRIEKFNVIVSNPPYLDAGDPASDKYVLKYEPNIALISGKNGLQDLEKIISQTRPYLHKSGSLVLEHGFQQADAINHLLSSNGYKNISTYQDLSKHDRAIIGRFI